MGRGTSLTPAQDTVADQLSERDRVFFRAYLELGDGTRAAMQAFGYQDPAVAATAARRVFRRFPGAFKVLMDSKGLDDARLLDDLDDQLKAQKTLTAKSEGQITDTLDVADNAARTQALRMALTMKGHLREHISLEDPDGQPLGPVYLPTSDRYREAIGADVHVEDAEYTEGGGGQAEGAGVTGDRSHHPPSLY